MKRVNLSLILVVCFAGLLGVICSCNKEETPGIKPPSPGPAGPEQYETPFENIPATSDIVMYEINERAFSREGDFDGILPRLQNIKDLGVNVIWLMPIHPIGELNSVNSPYCVQNYFEVNPEYGDLESLRNLVREAHKLDMAVIIDWVANHTSWDNPWIQNTNWYTQDGDGNIIHPSGTEWLDVADLDFSNDQMRLKMIEALKYWVLTANIDGFRCDAVDYVPFSFWKQAIDTLKNIPDRELILLGEGSRSDHFTAGFQMIYAWDFYYRSLDVFNSNASATIYYSTHTSEYTKAPEGDQLLRYTTNHDEYAWNDTPAALFGSIDASTAAFVINAYMGGVPLIYNGQEVACSVKIPIFTQYPINWSKNLDVLEAYEKIMQVRTQYSAFRHGDLVSFSTDNVAAFQRTDTDSEIAVFVNTRDNEQAIALPLTVQNTTWEDAFSDSGMELSDTLRLGAYEYKVLAR